MPQTNVIIEICPPLLFTLYNTKNIAWHIIITGELIFYADKIMVIGNSENLRVFNLEILLKSQKFDAREIYMFYSTHTQHILLSRNYLFYMQISAIISLAARHGQFKSNFWARPVRTSVVYTDETILLYVCESLSRIDVCMVCYHWACGTCN